MCFRVAVSAARDARRGRALPLPGRAARAHRPGRLGPPQRLPLPLTHLRGKPVMISKTRMAAAGFAAALSVVLAACGGAPVNNGPVDTAESLADVTAFNPQPYENLRDGGTLTTALPELSPQMNIWQN